MVTAQMVKELREKTGAGMLDCKKALEANDGDIKAAIDWLREKGISKAEKKASRVAAEGLCNVVVLGNKALLYEVNSETDFVAKNEQFLALLNKLGEVLINSNATTDEEAFAVEVDGQTVKDLLTNATATIGEKITLRRITVVNKTDSQVFGAYKHQGGRIASLSVIEGGNDVVAKDIAMHVAANNPRYLNQESISPEVVEHERQVLRAEALNEGKPEAIVDKMVIGRLNKYLKEICLVNQPFVKDPDQTVEQYVKANKGSVVNYVRLEVGEGLEKKVDNFVEEVMAQVKA